MVKDQALKYPSNFTKSISIIQFGGGNFIRAFVDYAIQILNEQFNFNAKITIVKPTNSISYHNFVAQNYKFHVFSEGIFNNKKIRKVKIIDCIENIINPYEDFKNYLKIAEKENLKFIFSNTTELGLVFDPTDKFNMEPPNSFPAKITLLLFRRYMKFNGSFEKTLTIIPCELIEDNAFVLRDLILKYCELWGLDKKFKIWIKNNNFYNSLVDRIVPGFPEKKLKHYTSMTKFKDNHIVVCEPYFKWIIQAKKDFSNEFPLNFVNNLDVKFVSDISKFRNRKIRILNGLHTCLTPLCLLNNIDLVSESLKDSFIKHFVEKLLYDEILVSIEDDEYKEIKAFSLSVIERFKNPYIDHYYKSILLNSISKFKVRVIPSIKSFLDTKSFLPPNLIFSLGCLIYYYGNHNDEIDDNKKYLLFFDQVFKNKSENIISNLILKNDSLWGMDLTLIKNLEKFISYIICELKSNKVEKVYFNFIKKVKKSNNFLSGSKRRSSVD